MICKNCSNIITQDEKFCSNCGKEIIVEYTWLDDSMVIKSLPNFLQEEYIRLKELVTKNQIYGAKFQLKDIFELLLKLPISILASTLHTNDSLSDKEEKAFSQLLQEKISLGTWFKAIGSKFEKLDNANQPQEIVQLLSNVRVLFQENEIDKWRNEDAHGALGFDTLSFKENFIEKIDALNNFIVNNIDILSKLEIDFENKTSSLADNIINIAPFLFTKKDSKEVFLYEGYKNRNGISKHLNYHNANTNEEKIESINKLASSLKTQIKTIADDSVNKNGTLKSEMTKLENLFDVSDFERPHYIYDWIKEQLSENTKGIFLFQTQRGMGKSTAIRHLSKQKFIKDNDFIVIPFYINSTYNFKANIFIQYVRQQLESIFKTSYNKDTPSPDKSKNLNTKKDFAIMLNDIHSININIDKDKKILIVIDGLDEIPQNQDNENKSIYEVIPNSADLDDDIYFLLTSRVDEELTRNNQKALNKIDILNKERFKSNDERYIKVIKNYIQDLNLSDDALSNLLEKTDNRFLHISLLKQMYEYNLNINLDALNSNSLYEQYFKNIKHLYGDKLFSQAIKIIVAVANAQEPLTLNEILFIVNGDEDLTYKMIGFLTDFRKFFIVEDSYRGRVYAIYHDDIKEYILKAYGNVYKTMQDGWVEKYKDLTIDDIDIECDGEVYVLTYGIDINKLNINELNNIINIYHQLFKIIQNKDYIEYVYYRFINLGYILSQNIKSYNIKQIHEITEEKITEIFDYMLIIKNKFDLNKYSKKQTSKDYLIALINLHNFGKIKINLNTENFDINMLCNNRTLLTHTCRYGYYNLAKLLIKDGADVNKSSNKNYLMDYPLITAVVYGKDNIVKLLIDNNAIVSAKNYKENNILFHAMAACSIDTIKLLLKKDTINLENTRKGKSIFLSNIFCNDHPLSKYSDGRYNLILNSDLNINIDDFVNICMCHFGDRFYDLVLKSIKTILNKNKNLAYQICIRTKEYQTTPLLEHMISYKGNRTEILELLLQNGANGYTKDSYGKSAFQYTENEKKILLMQKYAKINCYLPATNFGKFF